MVNTTPNAHSYYYITDFCDTVPGSVWYYQPNKIAPPIFAAAYLASGAVHAWQT